MMDSLTASFSNLHNSLLYCREISQAQDRLTGGLQDVYVSYPEYRELLRMIMSTVGRGGEGDVGQRIRDEILVIQVGLYILITLSKRFLLMAEQ